MLADIYANWVPRSCYTGKSSCCRGACRHLRRQGSSRAALSALLQTARSSRAWAGDQCPGAFGADFTPNLCPASTALAWRTCRDQWKAPEIAKKAQEVGEPAAHRPLWKRVPGDWSARDLQHHAPAIIATKMHTNAHICATPQVVITSTDWKHREAFVQVIKKEIEASKHHARHDGHYRRGAGH